MGTSLGILLTNFDAFKQSTASDGGTLHELYELVLDTSRLGYSIEMQAAVFLAVIAVMVLGMSFVLGNGKAQNHETNKIWAMRLAGLILFIFGAGALMIDLIHKAGLS